MEMAEGASTSTYTSGPIPAARSSVISAVSIDKLFQIAGSRHKPVVDTENNANALNRCIRWIKECLLDKTFADELMRTAVAAAIFVCIIILMTLAQMFSDRWFALYARDLVYINSGYNLLYNLTGDFQGMAFTNGTVYATDPLFDHLAAILPDKSVMRGWLPDAFLTSFLAVSLIVTLLVPSHTRIKYQSIVVGRRMMWILSILYLFRMCSFLVTTVPNPVQNCIPKYPQDSSSYLILMGRMATGKISACTDNIYSGHTTLATVLFYSNLVYARRWYFSIYSFVHMTIIIFAILLTRLHYSVDVLIALFMTSFVYCLYHFLLLIHVDQRLMSSLKIDLAKLETIGEDPRYLSERRLIRRLISDNFMRLFAWMDGLDLRTRISDHPNGEV